MQIQDYRSVFFDCDGVLLNSNELKAVAFYETALPYGKDVALEFLDFHRENGGVSRIPKFQYFLDRILSGRFSKPCIDELLNSYESRVRSNLFDCEADVAIAELRKKSPGSIWSVVSGGQQSEVRAVLEFKGLARYFDGGIYGSPRSKEKILQDFFSTIERPAIFVGDSAYDYEVACEFGMEFVFIYGWTGMAGWKQFCDRNRIRAVKGLSDLLSVS